jgi:hypothetical protein
LGGAEKLPGVVVRNRKYKVLLSSLMVWKVLAKLQLAT